MKTHMAQSFWSKPSTRSGWWSVWLAAAFLVMFIINSAILMQLKEAPWQHIYLPFYGIAMILIGLSAGIMGAIAVIRQHEHSWLVWLTILPGLFILFLVLGEFLGPPH